MTPLLSNTDIITLDIEQTISSVTTAPATSSTLTQQTPGPTTSQNNTKTRVHIPDGFFLVLSGMIQDEKDRTRQQVPCLGGIPIIGALFTEKDNSDTKRNVMVLCVLKSSIPMIRSKLSPNNSKMFGDKSAHARNV